MLYTNRGLNITFRYSTRHGDFFGEGLKGCDTVILPAIPGTLSTLQYVPASGCYVSNSGLLPNLTICRTKVFRSPYIGAKEDGDLYLYLKAANVSDGHKYHVHFSVPESQKIELIAFRTENELFEDERGDKYVSYSDAIVVKAKNGDVFKTTCKGPESCSFEETLYIVANGEVYTADLSSIDVIYDKLGLEVPFSLRYEWRRGGFVIDPDEWKIIEAE